MAAKDVRFGGDARARMLRGEEERGTMDVLLATTPSRARLLLEKVGALAIALLVIAVLFALGVVAGEAALGGGHVDFVRALLAGLNLSLFAFFFGMVALLFSQLTASRRACSPRASAAPRRKRNTPRPVRWRRERPSNRPAP